MDFEWERRTDVSGNGASVCVNGNSAYLGQADDPKLRTMPWIFRATFPWPMRG